MEEYKMNCQHCGKEFLVQVTTMNVPGGKDKEDIICPYCHKDNGYHMTSGFVFTHKIGEE